MPGCLRSANRLPFSALPFFIQILDQKSIAWLKTRTHVAICFGDGADAWFIPTSQEETTDAANAAAGCWSEFQRIDAARCAVLLGLRHHAAAHRIAVERTRTGLWGLHFRCGDSSIVVGPKLTQLGTIDFEFSDKLSSLRLVPQGKRLARSIADLGEEGTIQALRTEFMRLDHAPTIRAQPSSSCVTDWMSQTTTYGRALRNTPNGRARPSRMNCSGSWRVNFPGRSTSPKNFQSILQTSGRHRIISRVSSPCAAARVLRGPWPRRNRVRHGHTGLMQSAA